MGILQARILEWVAMPSSRGIFPTQGSKSGLPHCRRVLYQLSYQGSSPFKVCQCKNMSKYEKFSESCLLMFTFLYTSLPWSVGRTCGLLLAEYGRITGCDWMWLLATLYDCLSSSQSHAILGEWSFHVVKHMERMWQVAWTASRD